MDRILSVQEKYVWCSIDMPNSQIIMSNDERDEIHVLERATRETRGSDVRGNESYGTNKPQVNFVWIRYPKSMVLLTIEIFVDLLAEPRCEGPESRTTTLTGTIHIKRCILFHSRSSYLNQVGFSRVTFYVIHYTSCVKWYYFLFYSPSHTVLGAEV